MKLERLKNAMVMMSTMKSDIFSRDMILDDVVLGLNVSLGECKREYLTNWWNDGERRQLSFPWLWT